MLFTYPIDVLSAKLSADSGKNPKYKGFFDCYRQVTANGGFFNLFRGFLVSILGVFAYKGLHDPLLNLAKKVCFDNFEDAHKTLKFFFKGVHHFFMGIMAYPFTTIQKRLIRDLGEEGEGGPRNGRNALECVQKIMSEEGIGGFFKGIEILLYPGIVMGTVAVALVHFDKM